MFVRADSEDHSGVLAETAEDAFMERSSGGFRRLDGDLGKFEPAMDLQFYLPILESIL